MLKVRSAPRGIVSRAFDLTTGDTPAANVDAAADGEEEASPASSRPETAALSAATRPTGPQVVCELHFEPQRVGQAL